ncbi:hypothetical protein HOS99_gp136 [Staphylococcus phage phiSA_BS1]|uniref:Uncharacterized protein n=2 Tax=Baoshanvirus TaxID=2732969 RepID=A0A2P1MXR8_9CAUD|nr:hypothetical protein HOS99_gp136 [Staphylococcus phage phiSA_BS1]YP_009799856.1 hypothetical protein HOT02_gp015 [Staphylococcus phage phiSA_BS2]AVP40377.1 hypothetical protein [Staphylococcus phage phiSA_BS1]AVR55460.1 hypothetical protein phiSABS2_15 [Staphylococcus phage phiSA_BS2]
MKRFLAFFDEMRECKVKKIGGYTLEYVYFGNVMMNHPPEEHIYYIKDNDTINATIGDDFIAKKGYGDSYNNGSKIKYFNTITDYLDYLYDRWEEKNKERLEKELINPETEKRKKDKLNKFLR